MSNALKVGDRVKIVPNAKDEILIPYQMPDALAERIEELTAVITEVHKCRIATVRFDTGSYYMDFSNLQRIPDNPRRTFEEICKELAEQPCIRNEFPQLVNFVDGHCDLDSGGAARVSIWPNGDMNTYGVTYINADQLAAISAACTEIAANYAAEHGKEEA